MNNIRVGIGYDLHRIKEGNGLRVGGITVSETLSFVAHSDGDVLIHAVIDSLLGSIGGPDIGELFPDTSEQYKDIQSTELLKNVLAMVKERNAVIQNLDCVIVAENPKMAPYKQKIREEMSALLNIPVDCFNLKAKTKEKVDAVGRGEAIECYCVSLISFP